MRRLAISIAAGVAASAATGLLWLAMHLWPVFGLAVLITGGLVVIGTFWAGLVYVSLPRNWR